MVDPMLEKSIFLLTGVALGVQVLTVEYLLYMHKWSFNHITLFTVGGLLIALLYPVLLLYGPFYDNVGAWTALFLLVPLGTIQVYFRTLMVLVFGEEPGYKVTFWGWWLAEIGIGGYCVYELSGTKISQLTTSTITSTTTSGSSQTTTTTTSQVLYPLLPRILLSVLLFVNLIITNTASTFYYRDIVWPRSRSSRMALTRVLSLLQGGCWCQILSNSTVLLTLIALWFFPALQIAGLLVLVRYAWVSSFTSKIMYVINGNGSHQQYDDVQEEEDGQEGDASGKNNSGRRRKSRMKRHIRAPFNPRKVPTSMIVEQPASMDARCHRCVGRSDFVTSGVGSGITSGVGRETMLAEYSTTGTSSTYTAPAPIAAGIGGGGGRPGEYGGVPSMQMAPRSTPPSGVGGGGASVGAKEYGGRDYMSGASRPEYSSVTGRDNNSLLV